MVVCVGSRCGRRRVARCPLSTGLRAERVVTKNRYYAVSVGRKLGIYMVWQGASGAQEQVEGVAGARYRGFRTLAEAEAWLRREAGAEARVEEPAGRAPAVADAPVKEAVEAPGADERVRVYTDGGCIGNPGPGGYGVVLLWGGNRRELSGGVRFTTNNRMELLACIVGLQTLKVAGSVRVYSDSQYVVRAMSEGWAARWRANRWRRSNREKAENADLWARLLELCDKHEVEFVWVRGHAGLPMNERCDKLAMAAARGKDLPPDSAYEEAIAAAPKQMRLA
jgi:ribonuclease HI